MGYARYGYLYLLPINVFVESGRISDGSSWFQYSLLTAKIKNEIKNILFLN